MNEDDLRFFSDEHDKIEILDFIFGETDLQIFDQASVYGQEINQYRTVKDITEKFDLKGDVKHSLTFNLWSPKFKAELIFRKIVIDPKYCKGHTFRFSTEGWGLIQLYFGTLQQEIGTLDKYILKHSHIGHFNLKGALK